MRVVCILIFLLASSPAAASSAACKDSAPPPEHRWHPSKADTTERLTGFYTMGNTLSRQFNAKHYVAAAVTARTYLVEAEFYRCNWNYGNAIHDANTALGMDALRRSDVTAAAGYLISSAASPGSPTLNSFGPTMILAKEVLEAGRRDAVESYLSGVERFWRMNNGELERWKKDLAAGRTPDFDMQLGPL